MKTHLALCASLACFASATYAFDRQTTEALEACHAYLWEVPEFAELPNAAISVFPGWIDEDTFIVFWNVYWDSPVSRAAGNCTVIAGMVEGFEDYSQLE